MRGTNTLTECAPEKDLGSFPDFLQIPIIFQEGNFGPNL
jgi:hypothetical protein